MLFLGGEFLRGEALHLIHHLGPARVLFQGAVVDPVEGDTLFGLGGYMLLQDGRVVVPVRLFRHGQGGEDKHGSGQPQGNRAGPGKTVFHSHHAILLETLVSN